MLNNKKTPDGRGFKDRLAEFILSARVLLIAVLGVTAAGVIFYFVYSEVTKNRREQSTVLAERLDELYEQWRSEEDGEEMTRLEARIGEEAETILKAYPRQFAAQRALFIRGNVRMSGEQWEQAAEDFLLLQERFARSYLAAQAIFLAAQCQEELGRGQEAIDLYTRFTESYSSSPLLPRVYFSLGRVSEQIEEYDEAKGFYETLRLDHPSSNWTNLAVNRIIRLRLDGKIAE